MIGELGYGTNTKLIGQYESRVWLERQRMSGSSFSDLTPQTTWDSSRGQPGTTGVLTIFLGGYAGADANGGTPEAELQSRLPELDQIFPGARSAYRKHSALRMHWASARFALGSYACYRPGQARWSGKEGERVGRLHFCGEHTSAEFQGYMEGAVESGERVARELLADLGRTRPRAPTRPAAPTAPAGAITPTEMASFP
jgi:monoamine oxidase